MHCRRSAWPPRRQPRAGRRRVRLSQCWRNAFISSGRRTIRANSPIRCVRLGVPPANVTVLADGVEGLAAGVVAPGPGTKAAILGANSTGLPRPASRATSSSSIFPATARSSRTSNGDEQGGNDEIFLPYDVGNMGRHGIENALVDDELDVRIRKMLDKGVDFFGVIDACHSATGFRAVDDDDRAFRAKSIRQELGVPDIDASRQIARHSRRRTADRQADAAAPPFSTPRRRSRWRCEKTPKNGEHRPVFWRLHLQSAEAAQRDAQPHLPHAAPGGDRRHQARQL